ncbi:MAG: hypothetical protein QW153_03095, partial [Candidatus Bilamarchaeaceae archaeon]
PTQTSVKQKVFSITYIDRKSGEEKRVLVTQKSENEYETSDGTKIYATEIKEKKELLSFDGQLCCPCPKDDVCVEPEPEPLYLCQNGKIVSDVRDCGVDCNQKAERLVYLCANGQEVSEEALCGGVKEVRFICDDGRQVSSKLDCGCKESNQTVIAYVCTPKIAKTIYVCFDDTTTETKELCGYGIRTKYYVCTDGRRVNSESDCSAPCQIPTTLTVPTIKTVYKCWDGNIVNTKAECQPYCNRGCQCPDYYSPVCADGKTYQNACYAKCIGIIDYKEGECQTYSCLSEGSPCEPLTRTTVAAAPAACCPGLVCAINASDAQVLTHIDAKYTCQKPLEEKKDEPPLRTCALEGETCTVYTTAKGKFSTCCNGLFCGANGICVNTTKKWCKDSDNGKNQAVFGLVSWGSGDQVVSMEYDRCYEDTSVVEWYCFEDTGRSTLINCKSGEICLDGKCVKKGQECKYEYCQDGIFYTSCSYNENVGRCDCMTKVKCDAGVCNAEGTACGSVQEVCPYEYCKDGIFYTGCYLSPTGSGQCTCTTHIECTSGCNAAGTGCR